MKIFVVKLPYPFNGLSMQDTFEDPIAMEWDIGGSKR
jgi:hypothetical protein